MPGEPKIDPAGPAKRLLAAVEARFDRIDRPLPERRYLLAGNAAGAAWDDEHVSVSLNSVQPGAAAGSERTSGPSAHVGRAVMVRGIYEIRILREWPGLEDDQSVPTADEITTASDLAMGDAGEILQALYEFGENDPARADMSIGEIQPLGPLGLLVGYSVVVTISPPV